jgi:hypothetical protein
MDLYVSSGIMFSEQSKGYNEAERVLCEVRTKYLYSCKDLSDTLVIRP